jgi:hypothetical protein
MLSHSHFCRVMHEIWYFQYFISNVLFLFSHFSLLLGCALPKWMASGFNDRPLAPFAGILSLGIGDTMVCTISYSFIKMLLPPTFSVSSNKSVHWICTQLFHYTLIISVTANIDILPVVCGVHLVHLLYCQTQCSCEALTLQFSNFFLFLNTVQLWFSIKLSQRVDCWFLLSRVTILDFVVFIYHVLTILQKAVLLQNGNVAIQHFFD